MYKKINYDEISIYLSTKIWFGKYKTMSVYEIIKHDIKYAEWLIYAALAVNYKDDRVSNDKNTSKMTTNTLLYT